MKWALPQSFLQNHAIYRINLSFPMSFDNNLGSGGNTTGLPFDPRANANWLPSSTLETASSENYMAFPEPSGGHVPPSVVPRAKPERE